MSTNINLSVAIDNVEYTGDEVLTVEDETSFFNYFFFTATSLSYENSTMTIEYDDYEEWVPEARVVVCYGYPNLYAIKVTVPKFFYSDTLSYRNVLVFGRMETVSDSSIGSNYNITITTNGCKKITTSILAQGHYPGTGALGLID